MLFDFYKSLLTNRQCEVVKYYFLQDLSLSEVAEKLDISRQGVYDNAKRVEKLLEEYESKLHLYEKFRKSQKKIDRLKEKISKLNENHPLVESIKEDLEGLLTYIEEEVN